MRVYLTASELETATGASLLELCLRVAEDGRLDLEEIKELRRWLRANKVTSGIPAVSYLNEILNRIIADGIIDRDELLELQLAIERVIPQSHRAGVVLARKTRHAERQERRKERARLEKERKEAETQRIRREEIARAHRLQHSFSKIAGVTFPNDDGSQRQEILARCQPGEQLILQHDAYNQFSIFATKVLRMNGEQLGHAPEYLAERIADEIENGRNVIGVLTDLTGGSWDKPTRGANLAVFYSDANVSIAELNDYISQTLSSRSMET